MKRLDPATFSTVLRLMQGNTLYFRYCGGDAVPSEQSILRDMSIAPGKKTLEDKYYVGFYRGETLAERSL